MHPANLGYVGFDARDLDGWRGFAERLLGMQVLDTALPADGGVLPGEGRVAPAGRRASPVGRRVSPAGRRVLRLRMDERCHRILVCQGEEDGNAFFGIELGGAAELAAARAELAQRAIAVTTATGEELALRRIEDMFHFVDPAGHRLELYHGLAQGAAFRPPRPISGFRTGELGFGHVVLRTQDLDRARDFYCSVLGFKVSDYVLTPNRRVFMHINGRHHSVAFAEGPGLGIAHIMVEANHLDDVGRAYDVALRDYPGRIYSTLGRHSNDLVTSFYVESPSGVVIEHGWGGLLVDDATWEVRNLFGPSLWGHDRAGLSGQARLTRDAQRQHAFDQGISAPIQVRPDPGVFDLSALNRKEQ